MSSNTQRPKAPRREHMGCCLVQQVFPKLILEGLVAVAYYHEAGNSCTAINADLSILEVVDGLSSFHSLNSCWADIAFCVPADKECYCSVP